PGRGGAATHPAADRGGIEMNTVLLAVLNTLWQAVALVAAVAGVLRILRGVNAATRHALWWAVLATIVALPFLPAHLPSPETTSAGPQRVDAVVAALDPAISESPTAAAAVAPPRRSTLELPAGSWP